MSMSAFSCMCNDFGGIPVPPASSGAIKGPEKQTVPRRKSRRLDLSSRMVGPLFEILGKRELERKSESRCVQGTGTADTMRPKEWARNMSCCFLISSSCCSTHQRFLASGFPCDLCALAHRRELSHVHLAFHRGKMGDKRGKRPQIEMSNGTDVAVVFCAHARSVVPGASREMIRVVLHCTY